MKYEDEQILEALHQDPIADAERVMGKSWKETIEEDKKGFGGVAGLGLLLQMRKSEALETMLSSRGDTTFSMTTENYIKVIERNGFRKAYSEGFMSAIGNEKPVPETFYIYFKEPALLLIFDTFRGNRNGGKVYYNWVPSKNRNREDRLTSSGCMNPIDEETRKIMAEATNKFFAEVKGFDYDSPEYKAAREKEHTIHEQLRTQERFVWDGDHDCREALILNLTRLEQNGKFIPWIKPPFVWALHHMDTKDPDYDYAKITLRRMEQCPQYVQDAVNLSHPEWHIKVY